MLDTETKQRINACRDILVGKIPDPKEQVQQITTALIYKFMYDMDAQSEALGGKASFFTGIFEKYAWNKVMDSKLGNQGMFNLYTEAIEKMKENPKLPQLFRNIFKHAFLPYRDPITLALFLKEINTFQYDHSERLGDAFEYLLSILGSQGDAGQFRTPRHIIEFMVEITAPKKDEAVLDPACGTAGFLISAYKYILKTNQKDKPGDLLTPKEKKSLIENFVGYDISPEMVRLSLVNMYLHGFQEPRIYEYDTLSSEDRWNEKYDVIIANPPFMTPKGGIRPHSRFSITATRSEVLFVDYMAEHLTLKGRAAIIVPEGIIFQSGKDYKTLRKALVENTLYGVISLPSGVFNPYSGVKTSILLLDKELAKKTDSILFVKIEHDGFGLGAQRKANLKSDLPFAQALIEHYRNWMLGQPEKTDPKNAFAGLSLEEMLDKSNLGGLSAHSIPKSKIAENGDYNLSGDRYKKTISFANAKWPMVELGEVTTLVRGVTYSKEDEVKTGHKILRANNVSLDGNLILEDIKEISEKLSIKEEQKLKQSDILICLASGSKDHIGKVSFIYSNMDYYFGGFMGVIRVNVEKVHPLYIFNLLRNRKFNNYLKNTISGASINNLNSKILGGYFIPLPPLEVQKQIVDEIENKQQAIDHAKKIIENLERERRYFGNSLRNIDCVWVELGDICKMEYGFTDTASNEGNARFIRITDIDSTGLLKENDLKYINITSENKTYVLQKKDLLVARTGATYGKTLLFNADYPAIFASYLIKLNFDNNVIDNSYYFFFSQSEEYWKQAKILVTGGGQPQFNANVIKQIKIPIPSIEIQQKLVAEMEEEQKIIDSNKYLIELMNKKIQTKINEIWGEE